MILNFEIDHRPYTAWHAVNIEYCTGPMRPAFTLPSIEEPFDRCSLTVT